MERDIRDEDIRGELAKAQRDWATITIQFRQARQDIVMKALAAGWSKYAIAAAMGVKGPTVDSIISTATREPKQPQAER